MDLFDSIILLSVCREHVSYVPVDWGLGVYDMVPTYRLLACTYVPTYALL